MTENELFEADYRAAHPKSTITHILQMGDGVDSQITLRPEAALRIWIQQRKRHEAEVAELVRFVKLADHEQFCHNQAYKNKCSCGLWATIAKFDAPKEGS